ncbi:alpha/beta hydrolase [Aspergillus affinis]|uniref:alpha/beta hydrolase n=1 Tax=Aspergillus affinis TaxID=1070780 RepID=UPI0022FEF038|nr:alpha/beta-hydrolase [Aspergillus affinis]KAI9044047.1 alpha/beta-hydrolase [Aspergillus affinis]
MVDDWDSIAPSAKLEWTPCFQNYTCSRLEVPLDYGDPSRGKIDIAMIRIEAKNVTEGTQSLLINPGGPGVSGVDTIMEYGPSLGEIVNYQHHIVGFDPRSVRQSGPRVDCWPDHPERRAQFEKIYYSETSNATSSSLGNQYAAAELYGKACTSTVGGSHGNASYISTPAVARDMLTYVEAEQVAAGKPKEEGKLMFYGLSYGTLLGATFAHMFPDRIERMILDGAVDAEDYYSMKWQANLFDTDAAYQGFFDFCFKAGKEKCSFWGSSPQNISDRVDRILANLRYNPIPIPSGEFCDIPILATYSNLKTLLMQVLYDPLSNFPLLANVLAGLEQGNTTAYSLAVTSGSILPFNPCNNGTVGSTQDYPVMIECVDGYNGHKIQNITEFSDWVKALNTESKFFGEVFATNSGAVSCRSVDVTPPETGRIHGSILDRKNTSFPILFLTQQSDPATPKRNAYKMSSVYPRSVVLKQDAVGHTAFVSASNCLLENVQGYLMNGQLPATNMTCKADRIPFQDI